MSKADAVVTSVQLDQGEVVGRISNHISVFCAIPYAKSPTGRLRFAPPEPVDAGDGSLDCTTPGAVAPQAPSRLRLVMGDFEARQDENCLTLTVWAPPRDGRPKPVLVWLHGGAYISGGAAIDWYSGEQLSREGDIVVVGVNYRLGALGFLHHPNVAGGNMGLLDQRAALIWVQNNIERFGGDPKSVTLCGQSAGASSIAHLITMPHLGRLFHRCIMQSAPLGIDPLEPDEAKLNANVFFSELGLDAGSPGFRERLSAVPTERVISAQFSTLMIRAKMLGLKSGEQYLPFRPVADGEILPATGSAAFNVAAAQMDVLIGTTREEFGSFLAADPVVQALDRPPIPEPDLKRLQARRPAGSAADLLGDFLCEKIFLGPSLKWAEQAAKAGRRVFVYEFDWQSPLRGLGSGHCVELPFVFGTWEAFKAAPMLANASIERAEKIGAQMRAAWLQFVNFGDAGARGLPPWPTYTSGRPRVMRIGELFETFDAPLMSQT